MHLKEMNGIRGIRSNRSKVFLIDYQNNVLAEAQDLMELKLKMESNQTQKALRSVNLLPHEAKIVWISEDTMLLIDLDKDFVDLALIKNMSGNIIALSSIYQLNQQIQKTKEVQRQLLRTSSQP